MKIKLVETRFGLFIGEQKFSITGVKLVNPYRVFINEKIQIERIGFGLAEVPKIKINSSDIIFNENATLDFKAEYLQAVEKDNKEKLESEDSMTQL